MKLLANLLTLIVFLSSLTAFAQTSYTWNGGTSTDFATSTNWTPNGVPGSGDDITIVTGSNTCLLDGDRSVNKLTMTSGTFDLNSYELTVGHTISLSGGTAEDGTLIMSSSANSATFTNVTVDCELEIDDRTILSGNNRFKQEVSLTDVQSWNSGNVFDKKAYIKLTQYNTFIGGNVFKDTTIIEAASAQGYTQRIGHNTVDTFLAPVTFHLTRNQQGFYIGNGSTGGVYCADDVTIHNSSPGTGNHIYIGNSGTCEFEADIYLNADTSSGNINFLSGTIDHDGDLLIGDDGYHSGILYLYSAYQQNAGHAIDLTDMGHTSKLTLGTDLVVEPDLTAPNVPTTIQSGVHFKGDLTAHNLVSWGSNGIYEGKVDVTMKQYNMATGGNVFHDTVVINAASAQGYSQSLGNAVRDTFLAPVTINAVIASMTLNIGNGAGGIYCADDMTINNYGATNTHIVIGANASADSHFAGDVILNVDSTAGNVTFHLGTIAHDGDLLLGSHGYHSGTLTLNAAYQQSAGHAIDIIDMDHTSKLTFGTDLVVESDITAADIPTTLKAGVHFKEDVTIPRLVTWNGSTTVDGKADLKMVSYNTFVGGNVFKDSTNIIAASAQGYTQRMGHLSPDTFLAPVSFTISTNMDFYISNNSTGNYYADDVTLNSYANSGSDIRIGGDASSTSLFDGKIILNADSSAGAINFLAGTNTHAGILEVGTHGYHSGILYLDAYTQTASGTIDLSGIDHTASIQVKDDASITADFVYQNTSRNITLNGPTFLGGVNIESPSLSVTNCDFHGITNLKKTGSTNNLNSGNMFRGATTIENASSGNYVYWGNSVPDTFLTDLTLINTGNQPLWLNYSSTGQYGGDLTLDGDSAKVIRFGSSTAGRVAVFDGSTDQHLNILEEDLNIQA